MSECNLVKCYRFANKDLKKQYEGRNIHDYMYEPGYG
jgi:hypothetical protein